MTEQAKQEKLSGTTGMAGAAMAGDQPLGATTPPASPSGGTAPMQNSNSPQEGQTGGGPEQGRGPRPRRGLPGRGQRGSFSGRGLRAPSPAADLPAATDGRASDAAMDAIMKEGPKKIAPYVPPAVVPAVDAATQPDLPDDRSKLSAPVDRNAPAPRSEPPKIAMGRSLRRQLDDDMEDELAAAMSGFDTAALDKGTSAPAPAPAANQSNVVGATPLSAVPNRRTVRVLSVRGPDVFVDIGERSEGVVPALQFEGTLPNPGDMIDLVLDHYDNDSNLYLMRRPGAVQDADWGSVQKGMVVDAHVKKANKGGLEVTVNGIRGFMPAGQVDIVHVPDLNVLVGQVLRSEITEVSLSSKNLVVSRKAILERERQEKARETLASLAEGQVREGVVKSVRDFGAFVDLGGVDGLLHISQMGWQRVNNPNDVVQVGDHVKVVVLSIDQETKKIGLGLRQLAPDPFLSVPEKYPVGIIVDGTVTKIMDFGAFVEVEPGIEGLVHVSELSRKRVSHVSAVVKPGQQVRVKVQDIDVERKRLSLSMKAAEEPDPVELAEAEAIEEAAAPQAVKKPIGPLKGGLGGSSGPLFGSR